MNITTSTQTQYTQAINYSVSKTEDKALEDESNRILTVEELLGEEGYARFNELISGMSEEDQIRTKLLMSFSMSIKSESFVNGEFHIERETGELDTQTMLSKLDLLIDKNKQSQGELVGAIKHILHELKAFYTNKSEANINVKNQEDSVIDEFLEDLYSQETINFKSSVIKNEIENKVNQYASLMLEERADDSMSELETSKLLNQYKHELLEEYKDSLTSKENATNAEQQAIIKVLLDENVKETSSLEKLLANDSVISKYEKVDTKPVQTREIFTQNNNRYKEVGVPDWMNEKIKNIFSISENVPIKNTGMLTKSHDLLNTQYAWFMAMFTGNAIAMSGGQNDMKINEENVNWAEVLKVTGDGFKNNMKPSHTDEMGQKYEDHLNSPNSPYYFYSEEKKQEMLEQYKLYNYGLNSECFKAVEILLLDIEGKIL